MFGEITRRSVNDIVAKLDQQERHFVFQTADEITTSVSCLVPRADNACTYHPYKDGLQPTKDVMSRVFFRHRQSSLAIDCYAQDISIKIPLSIYMKPYCC